MAKKPIIDLDDIPSSKTETKSGNPLVSIGQTIRYSITQEDVRVPAHKDEKPIEIVPTIAPDTKAKTWQVVAGNFIGMVYTSDDEKLARKSFALWVKKSAYGYGSEGHEKIVLLKENVEADVYVWERGVALPSHFADEIEEVIERPDEE